MAIENDEEKSIRGGQTWDDVEPRATAVPGPDGMPIVAGYVGEAPPIPKATTETFLCFSGPCRHYFEWHTRADMDNPGDIQEARQINRYCTAIAGIANDLTDDCVYACSRWEPMTRDEVKLREDRRNEYRSLVRLRRAKGE